MLLRKHRSRIARVAIAILVASAPLTLPSAAVAQDDDWSVSGGDARKREIIRRYKQLLERNPDEGLAFKKLVEYAGKGAGLDALIKEYTKKVEDKPDRLAYHLILGHLLKAKERHEDAVAAYTKAIELDPKDARGYLGRGASNFMLQKNVEATEDFERALANEKSRDKKQQILRKLADLAFAQRDWEAAQRYYEQLIKLDPRNEFLRLEYAAVLVKYKRYDVALEQYEALIKLAGRDVKAKATTLRDMGDLYEKMGDDDSALATYAKAMRYVKPGNWLYRELEQRMIGVYRRSDRLGEYVADRAKKWRRPNYDQAMILASLYDELGDEDNSLKFYKLAARKNSRSVDPRVKIIQILQRRGDLEAVVKAYQSIIRIAPGQARYQFDLAKIHFRNGDRKRALSMLKKIRSRFRSDPDVLVTLADTYSRFGMRAEALDVYKALVKAEPRNDSFIASLGEYYYQAGETDQALKTWQRILKSDLPKALAHARLGEVLIQHNMVDKGIKNYEEAARLEPKDLDILRGLASAYENARRWKQAIATWEKFMDAAEQPTTVAEGRTRIIALYDRNAQLRGKVREFKDAFEADPPDIRAGYFLAESYIKLGEPEKAERVYDQLINADGVVDKNDIDALVALEKAYSQRGRTKDAIDVLRTLAELRPLRAKEYYHRIAELSLLAYEDDQAVRFAKLALEKNPDDANAHARLAEVYAKMRRTDEAMKEYRIAIDLDPRSFANHLALAELLVERDRALEARRLFMTVAKKAFDEPMVLDAARRAVSLTRTHEELELIEVELSPLVFRSPPKPVYRKIMLEVYARMARPLVAQRDHGSRADSDNDDRLRRLSGRAFPVLLDALSSEDMGQRQVALRLIADLRMGNAALGVARLVDDDREPLRFEAAIAAARIGDPRSAVPLERALDSTDPSIRDIATWALGTGGARSSVERLTRLLGDANSASQQSLAALSLGRIGDPRALDALEATLAASKLRGYNDTIATCATWSLGAIGSGDSVERLGDILTEGNGAAADIAAWSLGRIGTKRALGTLLDAYWSGDDTLRVRARTGLLHFAAREEAALDDLVSRNIEFEQSVIDPRNRYIDSTSIARGLHTSTLDQPNVDPTPVLSAFPDELVAAAKRIDAANPAAIESLLEDIADPSATLRLGARTSDLDALSSRQRTADALSSRIRELANGDDARLARVAILALGVLADPADLPTLTRRAKDESTSIRLAAITAAASMPDSPERIALARAALDDAHFSVRAAGADLASTSKDPGLRDALLSKLSDPYDAVRVRSALALATRGESGAVDALVDLANGDALTTRIAALRALHELGAASALEPFTDHPDPRLRRAALGI